MYLCKRLCKKILIFNAPMTIKAKQKSPDCGLLSLTMLTCIKFEKRFEYLRKTTEFWVYATTYKCLSCYFMKQGYLASQKTLIQSVPFPDPISVQLLYIVCKGKILIMGECLWGGRRARARWESPTRQMSFIKLNSIFMWLNILSLQWSVKQIWWNSEHFMYIMMLSWT